MVKLGNMTTGKSHNIKYMWLVKDLGLKKYIPDRCYAVMGFNGNGWFTMYNGTLKECRS